MIARRKILHLRQVDAAHRIGHRSATHWHEIERGKVDPSLTLFEHIAAALELTPLGLAELATQYEIERRKATAA